MRTPTSCRRCATLYAITLYSPIIATTSASPPNAVNITAPNRHDRVTFPTDLIIGRTTR